MQLTTKPLTSAILASTCLCFMNALQPAVAGHVNRHSKNPASPAKPSKTKAAKPRTGGGCQNLSPATLAAKAAPYHNTIHTAAQKYDVNPSLVKAVITIESCFQPNARGSSGEKGLMQLMPGTARRFNIRDGYSSWQNIHGGSRYLGSLMDRYQGNTNRAIAAYNAGEGNVSVGGRIPNTGYVNKVLTALNKFIGVSSNVPNDTDDLKLANAVPNTSLKPVAETGNRSQTSVRLWKTAARSDNAVTVQKAVMTSNMAMTMTMNAGANLTGKALGTSKANKSGKTRAASNYTVQAGDTVYAIMRNTGVPVTTLVRLNDLPAPYGVNVGQVLRLR